MKAAFVLVLTLAVMASSAEAGYFECGVCQSLLHFWSNARVESTFESVCDAFPNYVPMAPDAKKGAVPITDKDAPKDAKHGLPVSHMERCRRTMDTLMLRLAEEGIVAVSDNANAVVYAPTTWENPAILEILCTYVYPKVGSGYCKGELGGAADDKCKACLEYVDLAHHGKTNNPSCNDRPSGAQENCKYVEERVNALPSGGDTIQGTIRAISHARDLNLVEGRFLACRDFLGLCNEEIDNPLKNNMKTYQQLSDNYSKAYDTYWANRKPVHVSAENGGASVTALLGTKSKRAPAAAHNKQPAAPEKDELKPLINDPMKNN